MPPFESPSYTGGHDPERILMGSGPSDVPARVRVPEGIDEAKVRRTLLDDYGIEIGGGLGEYKGKVWRIGLMGHAATRRNVRLLLGALGEILERASR